MLELLLYTGLYGPVLIATAFLLWHAGLRDPFLLTLATLVIGIPAGWLLHRVIGQLIDRKPAPPAE